MIEELHGIEPIRGYRSWAAVGGGGKPSPLWLSSPQRAHEWADGAISASCPGYPFGIRHDCPAPYLACVCGIYAYNDPTLLDWDQWTRTHEQVFGEVDLWGKVIEAERGYRAEHARVVSLYNTGETSAELAERLQVPLVSPEGLVITQPRPRRRQRRKERR